MAAPRNDKDFQQKHVGRPLKFKTAKELQAKIDDYFDWCDNRIRTTIDRDGNEKTYNFAAPYTMAGLAYFLDIERQTLVNYSHREPFFDTVARARARIAMDLETRIIESRTPQGGMFLAKNNFAYVDESRQTIDGNLKTSSELTPEAQAILAKASRAKDGPTKS
ncbi:MAG TPA: terminase small subunit [Candidatus Saccharimonadales bacterium]|nr:terminase small subunit [Candidatus Saccharimonadales bacterium]